MSIRSRRWAAILLLLPALAVVLACGASLGSPESPPAYDPTKAALEYQATVISLQLSQTAIANRLQQPGAPPGTPAPELLAAATETQPAYTATTTRVIRLDPAAQEISYGEKLGSFPRKSSGILFGFKGAEGDIVTILLESSNARPDDAACKTVTASTTFRLRTPHGEFPATVESPHLSSMRDYQLPVSGAYYVTATCTGSACNGHCTEADLSLEKK